MARTATAARDPWQSDTALRATEPQAIALSASELRDLRHELGNSLAAASCAAAFLLHRVPAWAGEHDAQALEGIRESLAHAFNLLELTPGERRPAPTDLLALVREATRQLPPERQADIVLRSRADDRLVGTWDPQRVRQVLVNLVTNAAKYSRCGTPIVIEIDHEGDAARVTVRDEGIGIAAHEIEAVFSGQRTSAACRMAPGSGIGLQLSRRLVAAEGGQLWATSSPGTGSTFYLKLPCDDPEIVA